MKSQIKMSSNRSFGIVFCIFFLLVALYPLIHDESIRFWSLFISIIFLILGLLKSKFLNPLNKIWFKFGIFIGKIISPIVMGLVFFFVVTPTGLIMRALGKDLLKLNYDNNKSYWINKTGPKSRMKNQF